MIYGRKMKNSLVCVLLLHRGVAERECVISNARRELMNARRRLEKYEEFAGVCMIIGDAEERLRMAG